MHGREYRMCAGTQYSLPEPACAREGIRSVVLRDPDLDTTGKFKYVLRFLQERLIRSLSLEVQFHDETPGLIQIYRKDALTSSPDDQSMGLAATFAQDSRFQSSRGLETVERGRAGDNGVQSIFDVSHSNQEHYEIFPLEVNEGELGPGGNQQSNVTYRYL